MYIVTVGTHARLLAAYREQPGHHKYASKITGFPMGICREGWDCGWPMVGDGLRPISVIVAEEQAVARSSGHDSTQTWRETVQRALPAAIEDAVSSRARNGVMIVSAREQAIDLLGSCVAARGLLDEMIAETSRRFHAAPEAFTIDDMTRAGRWIARVMETAVAVAKTAQSMDHSERGLPTEIIGMQTSIPITLEEAEKEMREVQSLISLAKRRDLRLVGDGSADDLQKDGHSVA